MTDYIYIQSAWDFGCVPLMTMLMMCAVDDDVDEGDHVQILRSDNNLRNPDVELQQRAIEYLQLSTVASADVLVSTGPLTRPSATRFESLSLSAGFMQVMEPWKTRGILK